jgi:tRNA (uracil-5-)-methyltransferase
VDPANYAQLLATKVEATQALLAPFDAPPPQVVPSPATGYRMRAEFRVWHQGDELDYVMFRPGEPGTPVPVREFPVACERIQALMPQLLAALKREPLLRRKLFQVEFLSTLDGDTLVTLVYHRPLQDDWEIAASDLATGLGIAVVGRSRKQKRVIGRDFVTERLQVHGREFQYRQYEQAFTQPNAHVNTAMIEWACEAAAGLHGDLLELYCGNGNFTLPLAQHFDQVVATELAKVSIRAAQWNLEANAIDNVQMIRLAAEEVTQAMNGERVFRRLAALPQALSDYALHTVFVDPPRAGLDAATEAMVARFPTIVYISCNPASLAANLQQLCRSHRPTRLALFDQFPYTHHIECGVVLQQR